MAAAPYTPLQCGDVHFFGDCLIGQASNWDGILPVWYQAVLDQSGIRQYNSAAPPVQTESWSPNNGALGTPYPRRDGPAGIPNNVYPGQLLVIQDTAQPDIQDVVAGVLLDFPAVRTFYTGGPAAAQRVFNGAADQGAVLAVGERVERIWSLQAYVCVVNDNDTTTSHFGHHLTWGFNINQTVGAGFPDTTATGNFWGYGGPGSIWSMNMGYLKTIAPAPPPAQNFNNSNTNGPFNLNAIGNRVHTTP